MIGLLQIPGLISSNFLYVGVPELVIQHCIQGLLVFFLSNAVHCQLFNVEAYRCVITDKD